MAQKSRISKVKAGRCVTHHWGCDCREWRIREAAIEAMQEIEYWHGDMLSEEARAHPRGSGWARVYDKLKAIVDSTS